ALHSLGELALQVGKAGCARKYLAESITLARTVGDKLQLAVCLETMAQVTQLCGQLEQAVQLNGAARTLREAVGAPRTPSDSDAYEDIMAAASATLGETAAAEAWAAGRALPQDQAISLALRVVAD
ncbi:MAG: Adenylate/guanylate cyclase, partial [Chloroflexi bacterium]|nr:Adenylate/guanylate cyclase [Chloroflexota bacterium]